MSETRTILGLLALSTLTLACVGPDLGFVGAGGAGGDAGVTTSSGGGDPATTTTTTTTTTSGTGGGACTSPDECPDTGTACVARTCDAGQCGIEETPADTPCDLAGQLDGHCDGLGSCVQCTTSDQCTSSETCDDLTGLCEPACSNGDLDGDETDVDCGGSCPANCLAGADCASRADCESNACSTTGTCESGQVVFVTSLDIRPDFGGALAGDAICQQFATDVALSGTFMAWLSDSTTSPSTRFIRSADPYRRLDGVVVADDYDELTSGALQAGIDIDQLGGVNPFAEVWTATSVFGDWIDDTCLEWTTQDIASTGFAGLSSTTDTQWTTAYSQFCNRSGVRLYCFQQ